MLNFTTSKIIGMVTGVAGISAGGVGIAYLTNNSKEVKNEKNTADDNKDTGQQTTVTKEKSIQDGLSTDNTSILGEQDVAGNNNGIAFKGQYTENKVPEAPGNLDDGVSVSQQNQAPESFKNKCKSNANTRVSSKDDKRYTDLKRYCTKQGSNV